METSRSQWQADRLIVETHPGRTFWLLARTNCSPAFLKLRITWLQAALSICLYVDHGTSLLSAVSSPGIGIARANEARDDGKWSM